MDNNKYWYRRPFISSLSIESLILDCFFKMCIWIDGCTYLLLKLCIAWNSSGSLYSEWCKVYVCWDLFFSWCIYLDKRKSIIIEILEYCSKLCLHFTAVSNMPLIGLFFFSKVKNIPNFREQMILYTTYIYV